jgi:transcription antitermination protein NusB
VNVRAERRESERPPKESRHHAREAALQMLYQWEIGRTSIVDVTKTFWTDAIDREITHSQDLQRFATTLATGVAATVEQLDGHISAAAEHWCLERMAVMDRLILRLAVYEFLHQPATPGKVIINEALELARTFSADDAVRFVNGILDQVRRSIDRE